LPDQSQSLVIDDGRVLLAGVPIAFMPFESRWNASRIVAAAVVDQIAVKKVPL